MSASSDRSQIISAEFDELAAHYETNRLAPWYQAHADIILEQPTLPREGDVLEVGCGTGYLIRNLARHNPSVTGVGVDISQNMLNEAARRSSQDQINNVKWLCADIECIDPSLFETRAFSAIICANALHYFSDPQKVLCLFYQLLEEGGMVYVLERDKSNSPLTHLWDFLHRRYIKDQVEFYSVDELTGFVDRAGFENVTVAHSVRRYFWKGKLFTSIALITGYKKHREANG